MYMKGKVREVIFFKNPEFCYFSKTTMQVFSPLSFHQTNLNLVV